MRKCIRCGNSMIEGCGIKVKGGAYGIVLTDNENKWWGGRIGEPKVLSALIAAQFLSIWKIWKS